MKNNNIQTVFKTYGNIGNGSGLSIVAKSGNEEFIDYLLKQ